MWPDNDIVRDEQPPPPPKERPPTPVTTPVLPPPMPNPGKEVGTPLLEEGSTMDGKAKANAGSPINGAPPTVGSVDPLEEPH